MEQGAVLRKSSVSGVQPRRLKKSKTSVIVDFLLVAVVVLSVGFLGYQGLIAAGVISLVPKSTPFSGDPADVAKAGPGVLPVNSDGSSQEYSPIEVPGVGNPEDGLSGKLTHETELRPRSGEVIPESVGEACPNFANGSMCFPSLRQVVYYHNVGVIETPSGKSEVAVPSTFSIGLLSNGGGLGSGHGVSLFAGHVIFDGGIRGPFADMGLLEQGASVLVRDFKGVNREYRVYSREVVDYQSLPQSLFDTTGEERLALVTCGGLWNGSTYANRVIVWAVPVA